MPMTRQRPGVRRVGRHPGDEMTRRQNPDTGKPLPPDEYDIFWKRGEHEYLIGQTKRVSDGSHDSWRPMPVIPSAESGWPDPRKTHTEAIEVLCQAWETARPEGDPECEGCAVCRKATAAAQRKADAQAAASTEEPAPIEIPLPEVIEESSPQVSAVEAPVPAASSQVAEPIAGPVVEQPRDCWCCAQSSLQVPGEAKDADGGGWRCKKCAASDPVACAQRHAGAAKKGASAPAMVTETTEVLDAEAFVIGETEFIPAGTEHASTDEGVPQVSDDELDAMLLSPEEISEALGHGPLPPAPPPPAVLSQAAAEAVAQVEERGLEESYPGITEVARQVQGPPEVPTLAEAFPPGPSVLPPAAHPPVQPQDYAWDDGQPPPVQALPAPPAPVPQPPGPAGPATDADWLTAPVVEPGKTERADPTEDLFPWA